MIGVLGFYRSREPTFGKLSPQQCWQVLGQDNNLVFIELSSYEKYNIYIEKQESFYI